MKFRDLLIKVIVILWLLGATTANANNNMDKWSQPPRDVYFHLGGTFICTLAGEKVLKSKYKKNARWLSAGFCFGLGLIKEFLVDSGSSNREIFLNTVGITFALIVVEF